jgi:hypothetical protein
VASAIEVDSPLEVRSRTLRLADLANRLEAAALLAWYDSQAGEQVGRILDDVNNELRGVAAELRILARE